MSPLPSLCFFSPCDHICICLRAETIEIYGLETDKNELLRLHSPSFALSIQSFSQFKCTSGLLPCSVSIILFVLVQRKHSVPRQHLHQARTVS